MNVMLSRSSSGKAATFVWVALVWVRRELNLGLMKRNKLLVSAKTGSIRI